MRHSPRYTRHRAVKITRVPGLSKGESRMLLRLLVLTQYHRVTDRDEETDAQIRLCTADFIYLFIYATKTTINFNG